MGGMSSPSKTIDRLNFAKLPKKPTKGTLVEVGNLIVLRGEHGALYTNASPLGKKVHCSGRWDWSEDMTEALDLLGLLTPEDRKAHEDWLAKQKARDDSVHAMYSAMDAAEVPGLGVTPRRLLKLWNAMDAYAQHRFCFHGRKPPKGATKKPMPEFGARSATPSA